MNNLINLLRKYNGKVARVLCRPSFVNSVMMNDGIGADERPKWASTGGRVVHQDGSIDDPPLAQFMRSRQCTAN